ncbi:MAG TPA: DEAD/DEAH box helicase, partial [Candidatus Saccharimonadales bacterium]
MSGNNHSFSRRSRSGGRSNSGGQQRSRRAYHAQGRSRRGPRKDFIDPARFIKAARPVEETPYTPQNTFKDFAFDALLHRNIQDKGFATPSPIQDQAIPIALTGSDIIGIANTGTGKTAAFALPVLQHLIADPNARALIMAPTRELAQQIEDEFRAFARGSRIFTCLLIGGTPMGRQLRNLGFRPRLVIGTPGRIKDHLERRSLRLSNFNKVVLDEVDRMLDMGFIDDIRFILEQLPQQRQSLFFSATMDNKIRSLIEASSNQPISISVKTGETTDNVDQNVIHYGGDHEKIERLHEILVNGSGNKVLVFDETQRSVERLGEELVERGFDADVIHGGKSQGQRQRALKRFKASDVTILVATDVAARGIDISD